MTDRYDLALKRVQRHHVGERRGSPRDGARPHRQLEPFGGGHAFAEGPFIHALNK